MNKVSWRFNSVLCIFMMLIALKTESQIQFATNNHDQYYAKISPLRSIAIGLDATLVSQSPGLLALTTACTDDSVDYMPFELMVCAAQELKSLPLEKKDLETIDIYYQQLMRFEDCVVCDEETARALCKSFNELCVRGNACIGGNLIVCGTICPDPIFSFSCSAIGDPGQTGATGITGESGITGFTGPQGALGTFGAFGNTGFTGATGPIGFTGFTGPQGPVGATGNTGTRGFTGDTGSTGFTGPQGNVGPLGGTGNTGPTGFTGFTGPRGARGALGAAGALGNTGPTGTTGFTGFTGNSGAAGLGAAEAAYLYTYFTGATSVTGGSPINLVGSASVPFNANAAISAAGITHTPGSTDIRILNTGLYEVLYVVRTDISSQFALAVNNTSISGASLRFTSGTNTPSMVTGRVVFSANAGDFLNLRCVNSVSNPVVASTGFANSTDNQNVAASIIVRQIG